MSRASASTRSCSGRLPRWDASEPDRLAFDSIDHAMLYEPEMVDFSVRVDARGRPTLIGTCNHGHEPSDVQLALPTEAVVELETAAGQYSPRVEAPRRRAFASPKGSRWL